MKKKDDENIINVLYIVLILILILIISIFLIRVYIQYNQFKSHRDYFRQQNPQIESWMPVDVVMRYFNVPSDILFKELKMNSTRYNQRLTLDSICKKNHLNCTEVVENLNRLKS